MAEEYRNNAVEKQRVKELTDRLEKGLDELFESERYKSYLTTMSKFHNYSFNNTMLIAMQKPEATLVAGYQAWQKNFERHVNKGEKAIRILAPAPYKIKEEQDKLDPVTGEIMLDQNGQPQKEEVEHTIPAFRTVSVFDVSQTDGKPLPEIEAKELLTTVEGYEDFLQAIRNIAPVPVEFEDIAGGAKGYYDTVEKRIAVQEGMSESQTIKTLVHETAHSILHDKELNQTLDMSVKDRNTKEVEAESVAYTVCQHFGIDTSEYSFGYIAGWSSGRDRKELHSSLDTIRKTASEMIIGIEGQLLALEQERTMLQEAERESNLLLHNEDLSEYTLLNVRGMDKEELITVLQEMTENDKLSVEAYLESKGAWTTEIENESLNQVKEDQLDVSYNLDTDEIVDIKELSTSTKETIQPSDVVVKFAGSMEGEWEILKITNMELEQVKSILIDMATFSDAEWNGDYLTYLEKQGAEIGVISSSISSINPPEFYDLIYDIDTGVSIAEELSPMQQAEHIINRLEYDKTIFTNDERNLIVNYAYKLEDMDKTRELAEKLAFMEKNSPNNVALAIIDAQAEIDAVDDKSVVSLILADDETHTYSYSFPVAGVDLDEMGSSRTAIFKTSETISDIDVVQIHHLYSGYDLEMEVEKELCVEWIESISEDGSIMTKDEYKRQQLEEVTDISTNQETQLLYGNTDRYGIYQLKDNPELATLRFMGTESLKQMGITKDNFDVIKPENYELIYSGVLTDLQKDTQNATLEAIYEKFNIDHPKDYRGHSLSVSDIVVLHQDGENTANFVDSFGFTGLPQFMRELEGDEIIDLGEDREQVMSELKQSIKQEQIETELAFQLADRYIIIQEATEGYEYTIAGTDFKEIDGGVYDDPDMTIREALSEIVEDIRTGDDFLRGNVNGESELLPLDYDELTEKIEEANHVVAPSTVIAQFRAKTEELFHNISELNATEIEETVRRHVQAKLEELGINANVIDVVVSGSRARGLEQAGSDLDVVVQLDTAEREDDLFSILNEESLYIGDVKVDINPITEAKTGTLENYLPQVEKYLEQKTIERQEQDTSGHDVQKLEAKITYSVAECSEFHSFGEYHENIASLDEAIKLWEEIPPERLHGIPSIGIQLRGIEDLPEDEPYSEMDILRGKTVDLEMLGFYPEIAGSEKAMDAIRELIEKIPDIDVIGGHDWLGQDMQGGDKISKLATDIDQFSYNLDTYEYRDQVENREAQIASIADDIRNGNVEYLSDFLNAAIADNVSDSVGEMVGQGKSVEESQSVQLIREAKLLLERLAEYKPLAKVEEMEEQNYNMIDNVLNNGAGKKEKKEEKKQDRFSLKARLAEKKTEIEKQSQGQSRTEKKQDREK